MKHHKHFKLREIPGSSRKEFSGERLARVKGDRRASITVVLAPDATLQNLRAASTEARKAGLSTGPVDEHGRCFAVSGRESDLEQTFGVELHEYRDKDGHRYRCRKGPVQSPVEFGGVLAVLGLDNRPQARCCYRAHATPAAATAYTAVQVADKYGFPPGDGQGTRIAIVELGGAFELSSLRLAMRDAGITRFRRTLCGGRRRPRQLNATVEVMLDVEVIATLCPMAITKLFFRRNTTSGFYGAILAAVNQGFEAVSISWGAPEPYWTPSAMTAFENLFETAGKQGTTVCAASGDDGSSDRTDGLAVDFPASAPHALACGGTTLNADGSEVVWNGNGGATGGGVSEQFGLPDYQATVAGGLVKRLVPDVSANADPGTGYRIWVGGGNIVVGGTSAASPLWAALVARVNASRKLGFAHPDLYALHESFRDVTSGNNGAYTANEGFDLCTGLGSYSPALLETLA